MPNYLVESYLPRGRADVLQEAAARVRLAAEALAVEGTPIRYLRSTFLPDDEICLHLLEADSAALVSEAGRRAGIVFERVLETVLVSTAPKEES
jgi:Nickel responsive protein SCO4226-like